MTPQQYKAARTGDDEMSRKVTIWRTYEEIDMAGSDTFHATKKEALEHMKTMYEPDDDTSHLEPVEIEMTKEGVAWALTTLPHR